MTVVSLKTGVENGEDLIRFGFSDGTSLSLKPCYLNDYGINPPSWKEGKEISPSEAEALYFAASCYRAERTGMRLIARAEQTAAGLALKLERRGHDSACVSVVVAHFSGLGLLNDGRYAELWLRSRLSRKGGKVPSPRWLSAALANRGIDRDV